MEWIESMKTTVPTAELVAEIHAIVEGERKLGWLNSTRRRKETIRNVESMLTDKAKPARLSRQVLFGRVDDVQTFLGYLVYWAPGLVVFEPAPEYTDYFGIIRANKSSDTTIEIHIDSLFDAPERNDVHKLQINFVYRDTGVYTYIMKLIGDQNQGGYVMFQQHAYTMLNWLTIMLGLEL